MSDSIKRILEEYTKEPYRKYDYYTLQNNFILAIFKIFKSYILIFC